MLDTKQVLSTNADVGCGQMGSTAACKSKEFWLIGGGDKNTPWHFREAQSRLTGVPKKVPVEKRKFAVTPISADPICRFPILVDYYYYYY